MRARVAAGLLALAVVVQGACTTPPTREVDSADAAVNAARQAGAERWAPERFRDAQAALRDARQKLDQKDYRGALSSATDAADKARTATQASRAAQANARGEVQVSETEIRVAVDGASAARRQAADDKVPEEAFADVDPLLQAAQEGLATLHDHVAKGDLEAAQEVAASLKPKVATLAADVGAAADAWRAAHPKGRGRGAAKPAPRKPPAKRKG